LHPTEFIRGAKPPIGGKKMNTILAIVVSILLITTTTSFVKECKVALQLNAAAVSKPEKEDADESVDEALKTMDLFRDGSIPTVEQVIQFDDALSTISQALRNKTITSEEVVLKGSKKQWFTNLALSLKKMEHESKVGWLTVMYQFEIVMDIKAVLKREKSEDLNSKSTDQLERSLEALTRVLRACRVNERLQGGIGSVEWLDTIVAKKKGDLLRNFPKTDEVLQLSLKVGKRLIEKRKQPETKPGPSEVENDKKKPEKKMGRFNIKDLA